MKTWNTTLIGLLLTGVAAIPPAASAEPLIGQIMMFGGNFCPRGWAPLDGQLMAINQHQALFSTLGTTYGGDGRTTFGLPEMRGRVPLHPGSGPGLSQRRLGEKRGAETHSLTGAQMPQHQHALVASTNNGGENQPGGHLLSKQPRKNKIYDPAAPDASTSMHPTAIGPAGGGQAHNNMPPFLGIQFCIALEGLFPSRN